MPPIENALVESDFNDAVTLALYLFERKQAREETEGAEWRARIRNRELAYMIALASVGQELPEVAPPEDSPTPKHGGFEHLKRQATDEHGEIDVTRLQRRPARALRG